LFAPEEQAFLQLEKAFELPAETVEMIARYRQEIESVLTGDSMQDWGFYGSRRSVTAAVKNRPPTIIRRPWPSGVRVPGCGPSISPDGKRIVYSKLTDVASDVYIVETDGLTQRALTQGRSWNLEPSFSPDGSKIVFVSDRDGDGVCLHTMRTDGSEIVPLRIDGRPTREGRFSPDGKCIACRSTTPTGEYTLFLLNLNNRTSVPLIPDGQPAWHAEFSPNGRQVLFVVSGPEQQDALYIADTRDAKVSPLTKASAGYFSPDGSRIVFQRDVGERHTDIYLINTDRSGETRITNTPEYKDLEGFSPDGLKILFRRLDGNQWSDWSVNLVGSDPTARCPVLFFLAGSNRAIYVGVDGELYIDTLGASNAQRLTELRGRIENVSCSKDGRRLVFLRQSKEGDFEHMITGEVYFLDIDTSKLTLVGKNW
jgi:Tol biopolymer transport system component